MENFVAFDILPNGLMIFKNKKVEYINQHILDILNISFLSKKNSIDIIMKTMEITDEDGLFYFFINNDYFIHNGRVVQIEHTRYDELEIFAFMLINHSLIKAEADCNIKKSKKINIDQKIAEHFKLHNIRKVGVLTFYKGLPLKNIGHIIRINSDSIEVRVDSKHKISLKERDDILLIVNKKRRSSALHGYVTEKNNNTFIIKNFTLTKDDMHLRNAVRIKPEQDMQIKIGTKEFQIYDISENGISIYIDSIEDEDLLKNKKSIDLLFNNKTLHVNIEYLKTIVNDNGCVLKIIFSMFNTGDVALQIKNYIVKRQNEIIKEIHNYLKQDKNDNLK